MLMGGGKYATIHFPWSSLGTLSLMIRDSRIQGSLPNQWLKVTYQFDPHFDYNHDLKDRLGMRPGEMQAESDPNLVTPMAMSQRDFETQPRR